MAINAALRLGLRMALLAGSALSTHTAIAQTIPSQSQTPPGAEVERRSSDAELNITVGGSLAAPQGADEVRLTVGEIMLDGGFAPVAATTAALLPPRGAQLSLADVYTLAGTIQQAYLDAGYPLVRVFVPVQDLDPVSATIALRIVSGYVGQINVDALDPRVRATVRRYLTPLLNRQPLRAHELERAVLLAGDVSGVQLASALSPGNQTGETILIASGTFKQVQGVLSADNRLSPELGREQVTSSVAFNSLLGLGERIGVTFATALDDPSFNRAALRRYAGIFADLPIGSDGLVIGVDAAASTARPKGAAAFLALASRFEHFGGRITYPIVRSRAGRLITTASLDINQETQDSLLLGFPVPLSRDQTRVARLGINGNIQTRRGMFASADVEYSRGLDVLDARRARDASVFEPLSRIGADAVFDKLTANLLVEAGLPGTPLVGRITMRAQSSFGTPLVRSEQLSVATPDLISGPPTGSLVGDSAYAARYQIEAVLPADNIRIAPYGFAAAARARLEQPTLFELGRTDTKAYGAGINAVIPLNSRLSASAQVEYSHTDSDDRNSRGDWVTFQIALRF